MTLVRFAPSPTGKLHVGNARAALVNWLFAKKRGGRFFFRLDDTDLERSREDYAKGIEVDLKWMGLTWDLFARQSDRMARYAEVAEQLKAKGRLYPCYETAEELSLKRKAQLAQHLPPRYDRAALALSAADRQHFEAAGRRPHWRFKLLEGDVEWHDGVRGPQHFLGAHLSDPVLIKEDGQPLYTLSSVVDDVDFATTDIIRGEDHVSNTAVQIQLFEALGAKPPAFAHLPLLVDAGGQGLSKRLGSLSLEELRARGLEPMAMNSYLAHLGSSDAIEAKADLMALAESFDLSHTGRAQPKFDEKELWHLNAKVLHLLPFDQVKARDAALTPDLWKAISGNLETFAAVAKWRQVTQGAIEPKLEDPAFLAEAAKLLPAEPWDGATWKSWTEAVKTATGRKGRQLFHPLRLALTGEETGPEMAALLPLIGRTKALGRLSGNAA